MKTTLNKPEYKAPEEFVRLSEAFFRKEPIKTNPLDLYIDTDKEPRVFFNENGSISEIHITSSLIRKVSYKGMEIPVCPRKLFHTEIVRDIEAPPTIPMMYGLYFEYQILGANAGPSMLNLPKNKRTGGVRVDQKRIDDAVYRFKTNAVPKYNLVIQKNNVQVRGSKVWIPEKNKHSGIKIYVDGVADLISPFRYEGFTFDICCIDLKLTRDREECYIDKYEPWRSFHWGCPEEMDFTQGIMYDMIFELPFVYIVSDYKKDRPGIKAVPIKTLNSFPDDREAKNRRRELYGVIEWLIEKIILWNEDRWPREPGAPCKGCPVLNCEYKHKTNPI